ncbi:hypothetical protein P9Z94_18330 [Bacillus thuringiensis]|nr:hypothetical protein [Bacillus thuringiensis]MEC3158035.1 hypothetical protein [Bacillus thuringiensis]
MSQTQELVNALTPILIMAGGVVFVSICISKGIPYLINSIRELF